MTPPVASGVLEMHPKGFGFLRNPAKNYMPMASDAFVGQPFIRQFNLAEGVLLSGPTEPPQRGTTGPRLLSVDTIEGTDPKAYRRNNWDELTVIDPGRHIKLETGAEPLTTRVMDLFTPIGFGQRGIIVAPPRTGKYIY